MVAAYCQRRTSPVGAASSCGRNAGSSSATTVTRRAFSVSAARGVTSPPFAQANRLADIEQPRIGFGDDLKPFHVAGSRHVTTLLTADKIQRRIIELAAQINADYSDGEPLHFVAVLKGAFVFLSDLARAMSPRPATLPAISSALWVTSFILSVATSAISRSRSLPASALPFE